MVHTDPLSELDTEFSNLLLFRSRPTKAATDLITVAKISGGILTMDTLSLLQNLASKPSLIQAELRVGNKNFK